MKSTSKHMDMQLRVYRHGDLFECWSGTLAVTSFLFNFPLFSDALLWM